jgi:hypothetical protein
VNNEGKLFGGSSVMVYEVDYAEGEKEGCSSKLRIGHIIVYIKLFKLPLESAKYYAGDRHGIFKEISKGELDFWLKVLADNEQEIEDINKKIGLGKKYTL